MSASKEYQDYYDNRNTQIKLAYRTYVNLKKTMNTLTDPKDLSFYHLAKLDCVIKLLPHTLNHRIKEWKEDGSRAYGNYSPEPKDNYLHTVVGILNQDPAKTLQQDGYTDLEAVKKEHSLLTKKLANYSPAKQRVDSFAKKYQINRKDTASRVR